MMVVLLVATMVTPLAVSAQTIRYQPQTQAELIAYLYGRIAQLMEMKAMLESSAAPSTPGSVVGTAAAVVIDTHGAQSVTERSAILRGEVNVYGGATANAWFEYGQERDFLDQKTRQVAVRSAYDRALRQTVTNLEDDERYFFRVVAQRTDGTVLYGSIFSFRTDEAE